MNRNPLKASSVQSEIAASASTCFLPSSWRGGWSPVDGFWLAWWCSPCRGSAPQGAPHGSMSAFLAGAWSDLCWSVSFGWSLASTRTHRCGRFWCTD